MLPEYSKYARYRLVLLADRLSRVVERENNLSTSANTEPRPEPATADPKDIELASLEASDRSFAAAVRTMARRRAP
jgi:hypothetical protein